MPLSTSARVSGSSAAMWRNVNSTRPSRSRAYSGSIGSFTFSSSSASPHTSSSDASSAPAAVYASSGNELPTPAPVSIATSCPRCTSSRAPAGVSATRYSSDLISLATPIFTGGRTFPRQVLDVAALLGAEPRRTSGRGVLMSPVGSPRRREDRVDAVVGEQPLQERLRPRLDAERPQRLERRGVRRPRDESARAERRHHEHRNPELGGERQQLTFAVALLWVVRKLNRVEAPGAKSASELGERTRRVVGHAHAPDPTVVPLGLEPRQVLLPRNEIVHLLELDPAAEPFELPGVLTTRLGGVGCPDLRRDDRTAASPTECRGERALGFAVHRRRVEQACAGLQRSVHDGPRGVEFPLERVPRSEPDDRAEPALFHQPRSERARTPAPYAAAKNAGSSSGPRPMWLSVSPAHASRQPAASASDARAGASPESESTASLWCETPRWRSRASPSETRTARTGRPPSARAAAIATAAAVPPCPSRVPVPTTPGPIAQTATSAPSAHATVSAE